MAVVLGQHQIDAVNNLGNGKILCGGVGSGKSRAALAYYYLKVCGGGLKINGVGQTEPMKTPMDLYVITTAKKRDSLDWEQTAAMFAITDLAEASTDGVTIHVDSWNNIKHYKEVKGAFFIFDEQRLVGTGAWVKSFLKIAQSNQWILLSATPGDTWLDYAPVFIANGFYRNITDFKDRHVVYRYGGKYPKINRYIEQGRLVKQRKHLLVDMPYEYHTVRHNIWKLVEYDKDAFDIVMRRRWNIFENRPIKDVSELFVCMRKVVNSDMTRLVLVEKLLEEHPKLIVFYNFNYELDILRELGDLPGVNLAEWNGHKHEAIPDTDTWVYLVQYTSGAEGWNCTDTDAIVFYSLNYSYRLMEQARGRIDRMDTEFTDLFYYVLWSMAPIDKAIKKALRDKKNFNEKDWRP